MWVCLAENQVCFTCHLKRGGLDVKEIVSYELVQFVGYFSKLKSLNIRYTSLTNLSSNLQEVMWTLKMFCYRIPTALTSLATMTQSNLVESFEK